MMTAGNDAPVATQDVTTTRVFDAPRDLVCQAWTTPEHVRNWWGPSIFTTPLVELDVRPGGSLRIDMQAPDGTIYPTTGVFEEIDPPSKLVLITRAFEEVNGKTTMTMVITALKAAPEMAGALAGMEAGWGQSFDSLVEYLTTL